MTMKPFDEQRATELFTSGYTYREIAETIDEPESVVFSALCTLGLHRDKLAKKRQKMRRLRMEGKTVEEIASAVQMSPDYVDAQLKKMGV